jgi:hypothetical protein
MVPVNWQSNILKVTIFPLSYQIMKESVEILVHCPPVQTSYHLFSMLINIDLTEWLSIYPWFLVKQNRERMTKRGHQPPQPNSGEPPTPSSYSNGYEDYPRTPARPPSHASLKGCCWCLVLLLLFVALFVLLIFLAVKAKKLRHIWNNTISVCLHAVGPHCFNFVSQFNRQQMFLFPFLSYDNLNVIIFLIEYS